MTVAGHVSGSDSPASAVAASPELPPAPASLLPGACPCVPAAPVGLAVPPAPDPPRVGLVAVDPATPCPAAAVTPAAPAVFDAAVPAAVDGGLMMAGECTVALGAAG